jgi:ribosomal protein S18 acetylase RimI-like enzyme
MSQVKNTPQGPITVRPATADDAAALRALRLEALTQNPTAFSADVTATAGDPPEAWAARVAKYDQEQSGVICVAESSGELIGMAGLVRGHWPKTRHRADIWGVYVKPAWRGCGIAEALLGECAGWARERGVFMALLGVVTVNTPAIRCYTRCGFQVYGLDPKTLCHDGVYYDELLMVKYL